MIAHDIINSLKELDTNYRNINDEVRWFVQEICRQEVLYKNQSNDFEKGAYVVLNDLKEYIISRNYSLKLIFEFNEKEYEHENEKI